jgi:protein MpaA
MKIILLTCLFFTAACSKIEIINSTETGVKPTVLEADQTETLKISKVKEPTGPILTLTKENSEVVNKYCEKMDVYFKKYRWGKSNCDTYSWNHVRSSYWGNPIVWFVYGDKKKATSANTTVILCGVHGDEITPVKFCYDVLEDIKQNPELVKDSLVVIAPLVTPDSFFRKKPTRYNARGVDVNRNFPTRDWDANAIKLWKSRYHSDKRRYPGKKSMSEQETYFQVNLIKRYKPGKILSVHSPLTLIDYDGPSAADHEHGGIAEQLLIQMSNKAGKYRINNYPFFTGSLGNWAGNERRIPTYTLELPNSDWTKTKKFYTTFKTAIHHAINHKIENKPTNEKEISGNEKKDQGNETIL